MLSTQSLKVCIAALVVPFWPSSTPARAVDKARLRKAALVRIRTGLMLTGIAISSFYYSVAQDAAPGAGAQENAATDSPAIYDPYNPSPDSIMGFEGSGLWAVTLKGMRPDTNVKSTTVRTQGKAAYEVINPPSEIMLTSLAVKCSAKALTGIGKRGALLQLDVRVQPDGNKASIAEPGQQNEAVNETDEDSSKATTNASTIEAFVTSKSRGLYRVSLGRVSFHAYRPGIYNTIGFSIPESVSSALNDVQFDDLVFEFDVSAAGNFDGAYLFDNLRVHSVEMVQSPKGIAPPAGYGGSIDLVVSGNKEVDRAFSLSPVQIPSGFHLKKGTAGTTAVQLQFGFEANAELTCTYAPASNSSSEQSYNLKSCTGSYRAGDVVNADWVSLQIEHGHSTQELHAQLAQSPVGDLTGAGLIPPMPTYWGGAESCSPAPEHGKVVTTSTSCRNQRTEANQIMNAYFEAVKSAHPNADWIVTPVPKSAKRSGNGAPFKTSAAGSASQADSETEETNTPLTAANDIPFQTGGDLNPGGSFDAYWQLSGNLTPTAVSGTDENLTHFDAAFTTHGVLFGDDVDVVDAKVTADTDSGETTPTYKPAKSSGTLGFYVFGEEIPSGGLSFSPSVGFSVDPSWTQEYDLPSIQIWIFDVTLGALVDADLKASGSAALSGADLSVVPSASIGGHISGGINLGIADGSVDAKVNLVTLSAPMTAQVKWVLNTSPELCAATLDGSLRGDINLGSGGGEVDLDATFGICPFCYTDSHTLFKWNPLVSKSWNLFNDKIETQLFALPTSMCKYPITVSIASPTAGATLSSGLPQVLTGIAKPNDPNVAFTSTYKWTYTPGANAGTVTVNAGANTANPTVTFGPPPPGKTATWTIGVKATVSAESAAGAIKESATAAPVTIKVSGIRPGVYISQVDTSLNGVAIPDPVTGVLQVGNVPGSFTIHGIVSGATKELESNFTVVQCNDQTPACSDPGPAGTVVVSGKTTATPSGFWTNEFSGGYYKFTMSTTSGGTNIGTASAVIFGSALF